MPTQENTTNVVIPPGDRGLRKREANLKIGLKPTSHHLDKLAAEGRVVKIKISHRHVVFLESSLDELLATSRVVGPKPESETTKTYCKLTEKQRTAIANEAEEVRLSHGITVHEACEAVGEEHGLTMNQVWALRRDYRDK